MWQPSAPEGSLNTCTKSTDNNQQLMQRVTTTLGYLFKEKLGGISEDCFTRLSLIPYHWGVQLAFQTNFTLTRSLGSDRLNSLVESSFFLTSQICLILVKLMSRTMESIALMMIA